MLFLIGRYISLVLLGLFNLGIFYFVFTPLTVYPVFGVLRIFDSSARLLAGNTLFFGGLYAAIIPACVAGAAYYLLVILNLTSPMSVKTRIRSLAFLMFAFLILNIVRILVFAMLLTFGYEYFDIAHNLSWYFGSTILVILIWFSNVWMFKIRSIPIYTDIKDVFEDVIKPKGLGEGKLGR